MVIRVEVARLTNAKGPDEERGVVLARIVLESLIRHSPPHTGAKGGS